MPEPMNGDPLDKLLPHLAHAPYCFCSAAGKDAEHCICDVRLALAAARAAIAVKTRQGPITIACGRTHVDDTAEAMTRGIREQQGFATEGGCGQGFPLLSVYAYRCVECGRWMHKRCILKHFEESKHDRTAETPASVPDGDVIQVVVRKTGLTIVGHGDGARCPYRLGHSFTECCFIPGGLGMVARDRGVDRAHVHRLAELALANLRDVNGPYVGLAGHQIKLIYEATAPQETRGRAS